MTEAYNISGRANGLSMILRRIVAVAAIIGGLFFMVASAAIAFFVIMGLVILVGLILAFLWTKAKITGKPFGPAAYMKSKGFDPENPFDVDFSQYTPNGSKGAQAHGPIIDATETPQGWTVED